MIELRGLPAAERVEQGARDLWAGTRSLEALWLAAAASRARDSGLELPPNTEIPPNAELELYRLLRDRSDDAYARYGALRRELDSFLAALEARTERSRR